MAWTDNSKYIGYWKEDKVSWIVERKLIRDREQDTAYIMIQRASDIMGLGRKER